MEIPGVNNVYLLKAALNAARKAQGLPEVDAFEFLTLVREKMKLMHMDDSFLSRGVNEGFSGGEKKRNEILQMLVLEPTLAILDETDSGLDIDALKVVAGGVNSLRSPQRACVLVTHYQRLLEYVVPDFVHVLVRGRIAQQRRQEPRARARAARLRLGRRRGRLTRMSAARPPASREDYRGRDAAAFAARRGGAPPRRARRARARTGLPTTRDENWKYANLRALERLRFVPAPGGMAHPTGTPAGTDPGLRALRVRGRALRTGAVSPGERRFSLAWARGARTRAARRRARQRPALCASQ